MERCTRFSKPKKPRHLDLCLPVRAPHLIVWTRESAVEKFAVVYKLDYGEFLKAASWKEVYEYQDEDEEYRVHDTPKIYSTMPLAIFLPY